MSGKVIFIKQFLLGALIIPVLSLGVPSVSAETIDYIKERRELIACVSPRAEPYSDAILMLEQPQYPGIQIDLAKELAKKLGVGIKFKWIDFFVRPSQVGCDVFMGLPRVKKVEAPHPFLKKSVPYFHIKDIFVSNKDFNLTGIKDFSGLRVAANTGTAAQDILRKQNPETELFVSYIEDNDKLNALKRGDVDVALVTTVSLGWYQKQNPGFNPVVTPASVVAPVSEYNFALGLFRADKPTVATFDSYINELIENGTIKKIFNHYGIKYEVARF